jgi:ceramide synthetase
MVGTVVGIYATRFVSGIVGKFLSESVLTRITGKNPLCAVITPGMSESKKATEEKKKHIEMKKFCDQMWMLTVHVAMSVFEYYLLYHVLKDDELWEKPWNAWVPCPPEQKENLDDTYHPELRLFYLTQLSIWLFTAFSCLYFEERRKDFIEMMLHHIFTVGLVFGSMVNGYMRIGLLVQTIHDASDVLLDIMKTFNYLQLEDAGGFFLTEISFVANLIGWVYFRLYVYPFFIIDSSLNGFHTLCADKDKGNIFANTNPPTMPFWNIANVLLMLLVILHIWWLFLILRIAYKLLAGSNAHDIGKEEYEGDDPSTPRTPGKKAD